MDMFFLPHSFYIYLNQCEKSNRLQLHNNRIKQIGTEPRLATSHFLSLNFSVFCLLNKTVIVETTPDY